MIPPSLAPQLQISAVGSDVDCDIDDDVDVVVDDDDAAYTNDYDDNHYVEQKEENHRLHLINQQRYNNNSNSSSNTNNNSSSSNIISNSNNLFGNFLLLDTAPSLKLSNLMVSAVNFVYFFSIYLLACISYDMRTIQCICHFIYLF